jgi:hypothetical protein
MGIPHCRWGQLSSAPSLLEKLKQLEILPRLENGLTPERMRACSPPNCQAWQSSLKARELRRAKEGHLVGFGACAAGLLATLGGQPAPDSPGYP